MNYGDIFSKDVVVVLDVLVIDTVLMLRSLNNSSLGERKG